MYGCATKYDHFVMVMEMLNQSLEDLLVKVKEQQEMQVKLDTGAITEDTILKRTRSVLNIEAIPIWHILRDLTLALQYLHKQKLMHRDIKPSNVLLTRDYRAKLCDFGLVREVDPQGNMTNAGSSAYKAPEVIYGSGTYTTSVDIFSLGRVIEKDILPVMWSQPLRDLADWILQPIPGAECAYGDAKNRPTASAVLKRIDAMIKKHEAWWHPKLELKRALVRDASGALVIATPRAEPPYGNIDAAGKPRPRLSIVLNAEAIAEHSPGRAVVGAVGGGLPPRAQSAPVLSPTKTTLNPLRPIVLVGQNKATSIQATIKDPENEPNAKTVSIEITATETDTFVTAPSPPKRRARRAVQRPTARSRSGSTTVGESLPSSNVSTNANSDDETTTAGFPSPIFLGADDRTVYISPGGKGSYYHAEAHRSATRPYSFIKAVRLGFRACSCAIDLPLPNSISNLPSARPRRPRTRSGLGAPPTMAPLSPTPIKAVAVALPDPPAPLILPPVEVQAPRRRRAPPKAPRRKKVVESEEEFEDPTEEESIADAMDVDESPQEEPEEVPGDDAEYDEDLDEDFIAEEEDNEDWGDEDEFYSMYGTDEDMEASRSQSAIDEEVQQEEHEVSTLEIDDEAPRRPKQKRSPRSYSAPIPAKRPKRH